MNRRAQRPTLKNNTVLRLAVALLLAVFVFVSVAHGPGPTVPDNFTAQTGEATVQSDPGVIRHPSTRDHCRVLDVAVIRTLKFPQPYWPLPRSDIWRTETAVAAPDGRLFGLFRPPKAVPEQA